MMPSQSLLVALVDYNPETGVLLWKRRQPDMFRDNVAKCATWNTRYAGKPALQALDSDGYRHGIVMGHHVKAHRAAWVIFHGYEPRSLDHINHDKTDNRICNLREVCGIENQRNMPLRRDNSSGVAGVSLDKGRWRARINVDGSERLLGYFDTFEDAVTARRRAQSEIGFHENHGKQLETQK